MAGSSGALPLMGGLDMRPTRPADESFLLDMFMAARPWLNQAALDRDAVRALYEDQYRITRTGREGLYPEHMAFIVEKTGQAVAHLAVDLGHADWRLSQLEVHPLARGRSIGSDIVRSLQAAAAGSLMPLTVSTPMVGGAAPFYQRLGFRVVGRQPPSWHLAWYPPGRPWPQPPPQVS